MSFVRRTRIVSLRVTEDEYQLLDQISRRQGANSVSEFLRHLIMNSSPAGPGAKTRDWEVVKEIETLRQTVDQLSQIVKERSKTTDSDALALDDLAGQRVKLSQRAAADARIAARSR